MTIDQSQKQKSSQGKLVISRKRLDELISAKLDEQLKNLHEDNKKLKEEVLEWKLKAQSLAVKCSSLGKLVKNQYSPEKNEDKALKRKQDGERETKVVTQREECPLKRTRNASGEQLPPLPDIVKLSESKFPQPVLKLQKSAKGLEVQWEFHHKHYDYQEVKCYELFALNSEGSQGAWKNLGDINSIKLPIKVTLNHFKAGQKYYFAVRPKGADGKVGAYSDIQSIHLQ